MDFSLDPPQPDSPIMPAAARLAVATSSRPMSHGPPFFLVRRMRRVKPRGNRIMAANIPGKSVPLGPVAPEPSRREAMLVPVVPMVSVVVGAEPPEATVRLAGEKPQVTFDGNIPQVKFTVPVNPFVGVSVMTVASVEPLMIVRVDGLALSV